MEGSGILVFREIAQSARLKERIDHVKCIGFVKFRWANAPIKVLFLSSAWLRCLAKGRPSRRLPPHPKGTKRKSKCAGRTPTSRLHFRNRDGHCIFALSRISEPTASASASASWRSRPISDAIYKIRSGEDLPGKTRSVASAPQSQLRSCRARAARPDASHSLQCTNWSTKTRQCPYINS